MAKLLALKIEPCSETYGVLGSDKSNKFAGVVRNLTLQLAPRISVTIPQVYVSHDDYHLFLLGNDVINREVVHFVSLLGNS